MTGDVTYQFEYETRLRCAFVGAGGHSFRNVYPALQYAPVDLVAVCDVKPERAQAYARQFGAERHYSDLRGMLEQEQLDAVFVVTAYDDITGRVQAADVIKECLAAGVHVWTEKPTASSIAEVFDLQAASERAGRFVVTGLKKMFTPTVEKVAEIVGGDEFGGLSSISVRYPQDLPSPQQRDDLVAMRGFLDHIYHPAAILTALAGPVHRFSYEWEERTGASVASLRFESGAVGTLHLVAGMAETSPLERVEVVGDGANVVIDNGVKVTYYRPGAHRPYGRSGSYVVDDDVAPLVWEPEFSLGQLYNKNLFYLGYVPEILHFCESALTGEPPRKGTLADVLEIMRLYDAYRRVPAGTVVDLPLDDDWESE